MNFIKVKDWFHDAWKTMRSELSELGTDEVITAVTLQFTKISVFSLLPSFFCTINMVFGYNTLFLMWVMTVSSAYLMHKKEIKSEKEQGLNSARAWVRFGTLMAIFLLGSLLNYPTEDLMSYDKGFEVGPWNFAKLLPYFQIKICQNVALYKLYLSAFGAIAVTTRKIKLELQEEVKPTMKVKENIGDAMETTKEIKTEKIKMNNESRNEAEIDVEQLMHMKMSDESEEAAEIDLEHLSPMKLSRESGDVTEINLKPSKPKKGMDISGAVNVTANEIHIK